jgi:hypothetical protein
MSYNNIVMYLVVNEEINKQLVGDKVSVQKVSTRKNSEPPAWFQSWFQAFEKRINDRFDRIEARIDNLVKLNNLKE